jgi:hypothetical protein
MRVVSWIIFYEVVNGLLFELMCKQTLSTLIWIEVILSIEPTWDICLVWYFSSFINSNRQRSNETLVCAMIQTSDPSGPCRFLGTLPPLLGLQHVLPCRRDFSVVIYCHMLDGNFMVQLRDFLHLQIFGTAVIRTADLRTCRWMRYQLSYAASLPMYIYIYLFIYLFIYLYREKTNKYWHIFGLKCSRR